MPGRKQTPLGWALGFLSGLATLALGTTLAFWQLTGNEVKRSADEVRREEERRVADAKRAVPPPVIVDSAAADSARAIAIAAAVAAAEGTTWSRSPEEALGDALFLLREAGRLPEALALLERWLERHPRDGGRFVLAARLAFEIQEYDRGVGHYRRALAVTGDSAVRGELATRVVAELEPEAARAALEGSFDLDDAGASLRIALARLLWRDGDPEAGEEVLAAVPRGEIAAVDALRRAMRLSWDADSATARRWVDEEPDDLAYRLAWARALRRGGAYGAALAPFSFVMARDTSLRLREEAADVAVAADSQRVAERLWREVVEREPNRLAPRISWLRARVAMGDEAGAVQEYERLLAAAPPSDELAYETVATTEVLTDRELAVRLRERLLVWRPTDEGLRVRQAQDLEAAGRPRDAEAQLDALLAAAPARTAAPLLMRGRLRAGRRDLAGALDDVRAADRLEPGVEVALLEGDLNRWTGRAERRSAAKAAYARAAERSSPDDPRVLERWREMERQRRDLLHQEPLFGTTVTTSQLSDVNGFDNLAIRAQHGVSPFTNLAIVTAAAEVRRIGGLGLPGQQAFGGDIGAFRRIGALALALRGGALAFEDGETFGTGAVDAVWTSGTTRLRGLATRQPAYERLRAPQAAGPGLRLGETAVQGAASGVVRERIELYAQADHVWIGDGNRLSVAVANARVPLAFGGDLGALYTGSYAGFGDATPAYWSPERFVTQGIGLDYRRWRPTGWSVSARLAPAYAWIRQDTPGVGVQAISAAQVNATADAAWRRNAWDVGVYGGYGQDRDATYSAVFVGLRARREW